MPRVYQGEMVPSLHHGTRCQTLAFIKELDGNRCVTHSANKKFGERNCVVGMCVHRLRFGSLALCLSRQIPVSHYYGRKKRCAWYIVWKSCFSRLPVFGPAGLYQWCMFTYSKKESPMLFYSGIFKVKNRKEMLYCLWCLSGCGTESSSSMPVKAHSDSRFSAWDAFVTEKSLFTSNSSYLHF